MNHALWPMLIPAAAAFWAGLWSASRCRSGRSRAVLLFCAAALAVPGALFFVYYLHVLDRAEWFYRLRSLPWTELAAAPVGFLGGVLWKLLAGLKSPVLAFLRLPMAGCLAVGLLVPYIKPVLQPLEVSPGAERWNDVVCLQSTGATCGPASAATALRSLGIAAKESELARESFTSSTGTECWYLARALGRRGVLVNFIVMPPPPGEMPWPAIAGTRLGGPRGAGHFVAVLGREGDRYIIGDPLCGVRRVRLGGSGPDSAAAQGYWFTGFFMTINPPAAGPAQKPQSLTCLLVIQSR